MTNTNHALLAVALMIVTACTQPNQKTTEVVAELPLCGTVQFTDGCTDELDVQIAYGLALIHHMTYDESEEVFDQVMAAQPDCFWGPWGKAMTYIHPLWNDPPSEERIKSGTNLAQQALKLAKNEKEMRYAKALAAYYDNAPEKTEKERLKNYHDHWKIAYDANTADLEAKSFYALSLIAISDPSDKTFANQVKAGMLAEQVMKEIPDHPGAFHYTIHAYDYPGLSEKALAVANSYGKIAPEIPHALHMPSHIYTRLGMWKESIDWNKKSADIAFKKPIQGSISMHYFHALDYMIYAYLQQGEDVRARELLTTMKTLSGNFQPHAATAYALAAAESRYFLERQDWKNAAALALPASEFTWQKFPEFEVLHHFAKGLGAARNNDRKGAVAELEKLDMLLQSIKNPYWANQAEIQKTIINAWISYADGNKKKAIALMKSASDMEWATQKHPITPGELLPAREIFGDLLLTLNRPKDALEQFEMSLQRSPQRLNSLFGAARAAELAGDQIKAKDFYEKLLHQTSGADEALPARQRTKAYLKIT